MKRAAMLGVIVLALVGAANTVGNLIRLHSSTIALLPTPATLNAGGLAYSSQFKLPMFSNGGEWYSMQPHLGLTDVGCVVPGVTSPGTMTGFGLPVTSVGTITSSGGGAGAFPFSLHRTAASTGAGANASAEHFSAINPATVGSGAGIGGFTFYARNWFNATGTPNRSFVGLAATAAALPAADPNALVNTIYFGANSGDINLSICSNDAAGTATCATLGASFPMINATDVYDFFLYSDPNVAATVTWFIRSHPAGAVASGTLTADLPAAGTYLAPHVWLNNSTSGTSNAINLSRYCIMRQY